MACTTLQLPSPRGTLHWANSAGRRVRHRHVRPRSPSTVLCSVPKSQDSPPAHETRGEEDFQAAPAECTDLEDNRLTGSRRGFLASGALAATSLSEHSLHEQKAYATPRGPLGEEPALANEVAAAQASAPAEVCTFSEAPTAAVTNVESTAGSSMGASLLRNPRLNKGYATRNSVRVEKGLRGLLPPARISPLEEARRLLREVRWYQRPLDKYKVLIQGLLYNEDAFYATVIDHLEEMLPLVYTPTIGEVCKLWGELLQIPPGLYVTIEDRGRVDRIVANWPENEVAIAVVTDGERILGLGDLGAHGMGIPVGKCMMYAAAGVPPSKLLPITIDVGTENAGLRESKSYLGLRRPRTAQEKYDSLVDELITALRARYGESMLIHWEDLGAFNAFNLLRRYKDKICTTNDDIQCTAVVSVAGIIASLRPNEIALADQRILFVGAGQANLGAAELLQQCLMREGLSQREAKERIWMVDSGGLLCAERYEDLSKRKRQFATHTLPEGLSQPKLPLQEIVRAISPTCLIGATGVTPGIFQKEGALQAMAEVNGDRRPVILALSNPTEKSECTLQQAVEATGGHVLFASGTQFPPVNYNGQWYYGGFANNAFVFPGIGLAVYATGAPRVSEEMFVQAAYGLANTVTGDDLKRNLLYPPISRLRSAALQVAAEVSLEVRRHGEYDEESAVYGSGDCAGLQSDRGARIACIAHKLYSPEGSTVVVQESRRRAEKVDPSYDNTWIAM